MKIAIYGLPCAGKDALISQLDFATHARLDDLRKQCADSDNDIIAGGCYSFPSEKYYGRQKNIMAMEKARRTWSSGSDETTSENPLPPSGEGSYDNERTMGQL